MRERMATQVNKANTSTISTQVTARTSFDSAPFKSLSPCADTEDGRETKSNAETTSLSDGNLRLGHDFSRIPIAPAAHLGSDLEAAAESSAARSNTIGDAEKDGAEEAAEDVLLDDDAGGAAVASPDAGVQPALPSPAPVPAPVQSPPWAKSPADVGVTIPPDIHTSYSPAGLPNRIPPRKDTDVAVKVSGWHPPISPIVFSIDGAGGDNGSATINGAATAQLTADSTLKLKGSTQTAPGHAGQLKLVARVGTTVLASSGGFSVSAIPQNWSTTLVSEFTGPDRGITVENSWESDSGDPTDLDEAERSEQVEYGPGTGCFKSVGKRNSTYKPANNPPLHDEHKTPVALITGTGSIVAEQTFTLKDKRTGATDIPARNSGFRISRLVEEPAAGKLEITTSKTGTKTTAKGFSSDAGSGSASKKQAV